MFEIISTALIMGFSTGLSCMAFCVPLIVPYSGSAPKPGWLNGLTSAASFSFGRLISYTTLLLAISLLKSFLPDNTLTEAIATLVTGLIAIFSALVVFEILNWPTGIGKSFCQIVSGSKPPFYMGMLAGFRPCPPLIAALAFILTLTTLTRMGAYLVTFWVATSIPILLIGAAGGGAASILGQKIGLARIRRISGIALVVVGFILVLQAIALFLEL